MTMYHQQPPPQHNMMHQSPYPPPPGGGMGGYAPPGNGAPPPPGSISSQGYGAPSPYDHPGSAYGAPPPGNAYGAPHPLAPPLGQPAPGYGHYPPLGSPAPGYGQYPPPPPSLSELTYSHHQQQQQQQHTYAGGYAPPPPGRPYGHELQQEVQPNLYSPYRVSASQLVSVGGSRDSRSVASARSVDSKIEVTLPTPVEIQTARITQGQCPTCGIETRRKDENGAQVSITNKNVREGRCLLCKPMGYDSDDNNVLTDDSGEAEDDAKINNSYHSRSSRRSSMQHKDSKLDARKRRQRRASGSEGRSRSSSRVSLASRGGRSLRDEDDIEYLGERIRQLQGEMAASQRNAIAPIAAEFPPSSSHQYGRRPSLAEPAYGRRPSIAEPAYGMYPPPQDFPGMQQHPQPPQYQHQPPPQQQQQQSYMPHAGSQRQLPPQHMATNEVVPPAASSTPSPESVLSFQNGWDKLMGDHFTSIDEAEGERLIVKSMTEGNALARGFCSFRGWGGMQRNIAEAFSAFSSQAASTNSPNALAMTGYCYKNGFGTTKNVESGNASLNKAVDLDHAWAMGIMAYSYQHGDGVAVDAKEALRLYTCAAELGYAKAMYNLGELYHCGLLGIKRSKKKSVKFYKKAIEQNHQKAKTKI